MADNKIKVSDNVAVSSHLGVRKEGAIITIQVEVDDPSALQDLTSTKALQQKLQVAVQESLAT